MANTVNGISEDFEWDHGYDALLEQIATTNVVDSEWTILRDMIKHKIRCNILLYLASPPPSLMSKSHDASATAAINASSSTASITSHSSTHFPSASSSSDAASLTSTPVAATVDSAPPVSHIKPPHTPVLPLADLPKTAIDPEKDRPSTHGGLVIYPPSRPPPPRMTLSEMKASLDGAGGLGPPDMIGGKTRQSWMNEDEAKVMEERVFKLLDEFNSNPPFTIQRICELARCPTTHYTSVGKYLRAIERVILVTSPYDSYNNSTSTNSSITKTSTSVSYRDPDWEAKIHSMQNTPLFSPIPFLKRFDDGIEEDDVAMSPMLLTDETLQSDPTILQQPLVAPLNISPSSTASSSISPFGSTPLSEGTTRQDTDKMRVDELDAGPIPSNQLIGGSTSPTTTTSPASNEEGGGTPHLIAAHPVSLSSTTTLSPQALPSTMATAPVNGTGAVPLEERSVRLKPSEKGLRDKFVRSISPTPDPFRLEADGLVTTSSLVTATAMNIDGGDEEKKEDGER